MKDVVVAGSGGAGLAAALTLAEGGAKVALFEKMAGPGGSTNRTEGMFAAESELQRRKEIRISRDEAFKSIMDYSHWRADPAIVRAFVDKSADTIEWLQIRGVEFIEPFAVWPNGLRTWHLLKGLGSTLVKVLVSCANNAGVEIHYGTAVESIIRRPGSEVVGIVVEDTTRKRTKLDAMAVILATGGYDYNEAWIKKYAGFDLGVNIVPAGSPGKTGDGIRMAWDIGAAEEGMGVLQLAVGGVLGSGGEPALHGIAASFQPYLWVNLQGRRFADEGVAHNFVFSGNAISKQKGGYSFTIFDEDIKRYLLEKGIDAALGAYVPVATRLAGLDAYIEASLAAGDSRAIEADGLRDLAGKMKIDPAALERTVAEYNEFCKKGHDDRFAKDPRYLLPIKTPKFYALRCSVAFLATMGGIKINDRMEVLDRDHNVIPGLYAAGNDAGGMYGDSYDLFCPGSTLGFAVNSGRLAGENAMAYVRALKGRMS
jgi:fumarate reductase flavoprotein subunit